MGDVVRVLHVDDDPDFVSLSATLLEREDDRFRVQTATSISEALRRLHDEPFDCLISDYDMPDQNGLEFLKTVRDDYPDLPFVLFTGKGSEEVASEAISAGVTDYLQKRPGIEQYAILANRVSNAVERYRIEREATRTRTQLEAISEHSADAILVIDSDSKVRFANPAVEELFGYEPSELEGEPVTALMPERYHERHRAALTRYVETGERTINWANVELPGRHRDGTELPLSISYGEFEQDGERRFIGIIRDVSDQARIEEALREREEQFRQLAENIREVVWMSNPEKEEMIYVNPAYEEIWGHPVETLYEDPTSFLDAIHPEDRERVQAALDTQETGEYDEEYRIVRPDGERRWVHDRAVPVENAAGDVYRLVGIASDITQRKQQLRQLETLISNLPGVVYRCHNVREWSMEDIRGECEPLTGYSPEVIQDGDVTWGEDIVHPDDQDRVWNSVQDALDDGDLFEVTYRIRTADGDTKWVWERGRGVTASLDENASIEGFITDVTDLKEREQELKEVNTLLSTLVETLPFGILAEDGARDVMATNQQLFELFDLPGSPDEVLGADCERMAEEVSEQFVGSDEFIDRITEIIAEREPVSNEELVREDGRVFERDYRPLDLPGGNGHLWIYSDVTDRTERERTLQLMTRRLEALNRATEDLLDADTREKVAEIGVEVAEEILDLEANAIHLYDEAESALVPVAATDAVGELIGEPPVFTPGDSIAWRVYEQGEARAIDDVHADSDVYNPASSIRSELLIPIADDGVLLAGSPSHAAFDQQDVLLGEILAGNIATAFEQGEQTEQLRAREAELTRKNERLEEFASVVSHDLRNPLNVASGWLELVRDDCDSEHLEKVERAHGRMETLIDDLLTLAREGETETDVTSIGLDAFVKHCWQNVETKEATLVVDVDRTVQADENRLKQLFENLFRNAVEHGGPDVTVTVGALDDGFYVEDDGPGIPPDERERVFEAGYSSSNEGTGFGLDIVRQVVEAHDWELALTEGSEGGARFEITGIEEAIAG